MVEVKNVLSLCYDRLTEIDKETFIVSEKGQYGIINHNNEIIIPFTGTQIVKVGALIFVKDRNGYKQINLKSKEVDNISIWDPVECGKAVIVNLPGEGQAVIGSDGEYLMPPIYDRIRINATKFSSTTIWVKYKDREFIAEVNLDGTYVNKLDEKIVDGSDIRFIATGYGITKKHSRSTWSIHKNFVLKYEVFKKYDVVTNGKYDDVMYLQAYRKFNLIHTWKDGYAGLINTDGKTIIPNDRFCKVDCIGYDGICPVAMYRKNGSLGYGVFKDGKGQTVDADFDGYTTGANIPIVYFYIDGEMGRDWWILGNDGNVYKNVIEAFNVIRINNKDIEAYKINIYGKEYTVDAKMNLLNT